MKSVWRAVAVLYLCLTGGYACAQKMIEYTAGTGSRYPDRANVWVLYNGVKASHEGMTLDADSAHYNTLENSFTAFGDIVIRLTDTTTIWGDSLYYDGNARVVDIWADTVVLVDGETTLKSNHLTYNRNTSTAYYNLWGHGTSSDRVLDSKQGFYNSALKEFYIYGDVVLSDSSATLLTDTLTYNTISRIAHFESPTHIYSDSSVIYSELGDYNTTSRFAISYRGSHVDNQKKSIDSDTLYYDAIQEYGKAFGHVNIIDSTNDLHCTGRYGETNQSLHYSFVTDSAHVLFIDNGDSLFLHADTIYITTDSSNHMQAVRANYKVKLYRRDVQAMGDSAFYSASDSVITLFGSPFLWYDHYHGSADTISLFIDSAGVKHAYLRNDCFAIEQVDRDRFNQLKGKRGRVYFENGEPKYVDILGNAQMVYYITETNAERRPELVGVNVGVGTDMRIYFDNNRAPARVVTYDKADMQTYPVEALPDDQKQLNGYNWAPQKRPRSPQDVFVW